MSAPTPTDAPVTELPRTSGGRLYQAGDIIAQKYCLTRLLGEGGMGAVWLAKNLRLEVDVAIKLIRHELATDETAERLLKEARAAARIGHRSIVRVFDFGETELDDPFIVMEVLTGESLRALLERKGQRLSAANAVRTLLPIASALVEAHAAGIVHRDLKPENIMLVPDPSGGVVPKLVDFGIAKLRRGEGNDEARAPLTLVGTPDYMSPEQAGGVDEVDEAADVWALAVILYEAIAGRVPFRGTSYAALIFSIMTEEPVPTHEQMGGDAALWGILHGALAKQAKDRPSMRAFGTELARWALAAGVDSDVAGTSVAAAWLPADSSSPFSALPPPMPDGSLLAPRLPRDLGPVTEWPRPGMDETPGPAVTSEKGALSGSQPRPVAAPPRRESPGLGVARLALAAVLGAALILAITSRRGVTMGDPQRVPQAPPVLVAPTPSVASVAAELSGSAAAASTGVTSAPPAPPAAAPSETVEPTAPTATVPPRWVGRPPLSRPPRKSTLPIATKPNF